MEGARTEGLGRLGLNLVGLIGSLVVVVGSILMKVPGGNRLRVVESTRDDETGSGFLLFKIDGVGTNRLLVLVGGLKGLSCCTEESVTLTRLVGLTTILVVKGMSSVFRGITGRLLKVPSTTSMSSSSMSNVWVGLIVGLRCLGGRG